METILVCSIIICLMGFVLFIAPLVDENSDMVLMVIGALIMIISIVIIREVSRRAEHIAEPTAMDVYQDKTELQYTVRSGVVVDSMVVLKQDNIGE